MNGDSHSTKNTSGENQHLYSLTIHIKFHEEKHLTPNTQNRKHLLLPWEMKIKSRRCSF